MALQTQDADESKLYAPTEGSKFDFILGSGQKPHRRLIDAIAKLPRKLVILVVAVLLLFGLIIFSSVMSNRNNIGTKQLLEVAGRQQEIVRVSTVAESLLQDKNTQGLEATTEAALASDQAQLLAYLRKNHIKVEVKTLSFYLNKKTDAQLATARQSNTADQAYSAYVKKQLSDYRASLQKAYPNAGPNARIILSESYDSAGVILNDL